MFLQDFISNGTPEDSLREMLIEEKFGGLVIVKDIPLRGICEHHTLPYVGRVAIGYIPHQKTVGLSKMTRMVESASKGLTIQERVTQRIADAMESVLDPKGVMVVAEAIHSCVLVRGVKSEIQKFITSVATGVFLSNPAPRTEFLMLLSKNGSSL